MKVRDRLKRKIRKGLWLSLLFIVCAGISLIGLTATPKIFIFLVGGAIAFLAEAILSWIMYLKADPLKDEIAAELVKVHEINESSIVLDGRSPVAWSEVDEIRKVYRAVGSFAAIALPRMSPAATRRVFYTVHPRDGKWLQLSNSSIMAFKGSLRKGPAKEPDAVDLLKRLLTEAGKQPHIRLVCHNEAMARFENLDLQKEMAELSSWERK